MPKTLQRSAAVSLSLLLVLLALCASASAAPQEKTVWKIGTLAPRGIGWALQVENILYPAVARGSDDNLSLKVFWGGAMGSDAECLKKMESDVLQGAGLNAHGATLACPEFNVLKLPFLFENYDEVDFVRLRMLSSFDYYFTRHGLKLLLWVDQDFDQLYSTTSPMASLADFSKTRFVNWYGRLDQALFAALGAESIPVDIPEIASTIKSGRANSVIAPAIWMVGTQLYSVIRYVNPSQMSYSPAAIVVTLKAWDRLPASYRTRLWAMRDDLIKRFCAGTRADNVKCLDAMLEYGVKSETLTPQNLGEIRLRTRTVYPELADELYPTALLQELLRTLAEYRRVNFSTSFGDLIPTIAKNTIAPEAQAMRISWNRRFAQVRGVQEKLKALGLYSGPVDGVPGPETYAAVKKYQQSRNLPETGGIDDALLALLGID
ncbi:MAG: TRAP transporter substrate-binding protein DctP [Thermodesulfobacteriota bacterium]